MGAGEGGGCKGARRESRPFDFLFLRIDFKKLFSPAVPLNVQNEDFW